MRRAGGGVGEEGGRATVVSVTAWLSDWPISGVAGGSVQNTQVPRASLGTSWIGISRAGPGKLDHLKAL